MFIALIKYLEMYSLAREYNMLIANYLPMINTKIFSREQTFICNKIKT